MNKIKNFKKGSVIFKAGSKNGVISVEKMISEMIHARDERLNICRLVFSDAPAESNVCSDVITRSVAKTITYELNRIAAEYVSNGGYGDPAFEYSMNDEEATVCDAIRTDVIESLAASFFAIIFSNLLSATITADGYARDYAECLVSSYSILELFVSEFLDKIPAHVIYHSLASEVYKKKRQFDKISRLTVKIENLSEVPAWLGFCSYRSDFSGRIMNYRQIREIRTVIQNYISMVVQNPAFDVWSFRKSRCAFLRPIIENEDFIRDVDMIICQESDNSNSKLLS